MSISIASTKDALALLDAYLASGDELLLLAQIEQFENQDDRTAHAIIQGSGGEMKPLSYLLAILMDRGIIDQKQALHYIQKRNSTGQI